jgi:hypothetical protein
MSMKAPHAPLLLQLRPPRGHEAPLPVALLKLHENEDAPDTNDHERRNHTTLRQRILLICHFL